MYLYGGSAKAFTMTNLTDSIMSDVFLTGYHLIRLVTHYYITVNISMQMSSLVLEFDNVWVIYW